ncbi:MAG: heparinase II/III-family protein [Clostridiales bacterium]|jgi:hypothetical protein|nr:heparinase II/III-family protein [Clostridiales bacterium]
MFATHFSAFRQMPQGFAPFPSANDRIFWDALPQETRRKLIKRGGDAAMSPWPALNATDYLDFTRTGRRIPFEEKYFARRHLLNDLVMAECADPSGRHLYAIANALWAICEESGWQLPAHNTYVRDAAQIPLPNPDKPVLDLFACETAAGLALTYHLLGERLKGAAPGIIGRLLAELTHRIITPYLTRHFWWMGQGDEAMLNWTPWCTQNVLLVAAVTPLTDEMRMTICQKAVGSLDCFIKDYGEDGGCDEGAKYYGHAALCMFTAMEVLNGMTGGHFTPLYKNEKICNMADFIRQMHVAGDYYINFADCPAILEPPGALEFAFGRRTQNGALAAFAAHGVRRHGLNEPSCDLSLYTRLATLFYMDDIARSEDALEAPRDQYFAGPGVFVARDGRFCLAVKSGDNDDNHNHNDVGSITLYLDGKPLLIDVGVGGYTRDTFSSRRYEIWTMQSAYHNLPAFGGVMQAAGAQYAAKDVRHYFGEAESHISMDIADAYPKEAGVESYRRTVRLTKGVGVFVTDECAADNPTVLSLMFCRPPMPGEGIIKIEGGGKIKVSGAEDMWLEEIGIDDPILQRVWPDILYRVLVKFSGRLELEIMP